jgi:hypothetical protein
VIGWVGPAFRASAALVEILALVVLVRVGTSTAATVLRGAGHQLLALSNLVAAILNVALSIVLIRPTVSGVAFATLLVATIRACAVLILGLRTSGVVARSISRHSDLAGSPAGRDGPWGLSLVRDSAGGSLGHVLLNGAAVGLLCVIVFLGGHRARGQDSTSTSCGLARRPTLEAARMRAKSPDGRGDRGR